MPNFTRMEEDIPIITSQPISSGAEGLEAISKTFSGISHDAIREAKEIGQEQSNAMLLQTQAHADTIKNNAYINMIKHPDMSDQIEQKSKEEYQNTVQQAVVNDADRSKLRYLADKDLNAIQLKAAETAIKRQKVQANLAFYTTWPSKLNDIRNTFGDEKAFNINLETARKAIEGVAKAGAIELKQTAPLYASLGKLLEAHNTYLSQFGNKDLTARQHNQLVPPIFGDDVGHHGLPVDENTAHLSNSFNTDITKKGIMSSLAQGQSPNPVAYSYLTKPSDVNEVAQFGSGAFSVKRDINTGVPMNVLEQEYNTLKNTDKRNSYQEGRYSRLKNLVEGGRNGQFDALISSDGINQQNDEEYNYKVAAIGSSANLSDSEKENQVRDANNYRVHQKVNLAVAKHIDDKYIAPIEKNFTDTAQQSFKYEQGNPGNPNLVKSVMGYWDQPLKEYLARTMETPVQQEAARIVGNLINSGAKDTDINSLVLACQKGRDFSAFNEGQKDQTASTINYAVATRLTDSTSFASKQINGAGRVGALVDVGRLLTYQLAAQSNDVANPANHAQQAADIINQAFPISKGSNWTKNDKDFPYLEKPQMDQIANYLIDYVTENAPSKTRMSASLSSNPLEVLGTPTGNMVVRDSFGNVLHSRKYSSNLLALAYLHGEEKQKVAEANIKKAKEFTKSSMQLPETEYQKLKREKSVTQPTSQKTQVASNANQEPDFMKPNYEPKGFKEFEEKAVKGFKAVDEAFKKKRDSEEEETEKWRKRGAKAAKKLKVDKLSGED